MIPMATRPRKEKGLVKVAGQGGIWQSKGSLSLRAPRGSGLRRLGLPGKRTSAHPARARAAAKRVGVSGLGRRPEVE